MLEEDPGISIASFSTGHIQGYPPLVHVSPDVPMAINGVPATLDVRKVMALAGSKDSLVQISSHLDQKMPGTGISECATMYFRTSPRRKELINLALISC